MTTLIYCQIQTGLKHTPEAKTVVSDSIEKRAEFPLGYNAFRNKISNNLDVSEIESDANCEITFVVERDGSLTDIKAKGNNEIFNKEAIRAVASIKEKWTPGYYKGVPVRSRFKVPLNIKFDNEPEVSKAYFPGGIDSFLELISKNIKRSKIKGSIKTCNIFFDVETNGKISNLEVVGENAGLNKEVKKAISKIKEKWTPALQDRMLVKDSIEIQYELGK